jgi:UDP-N-acetylmuramoyl-tripeptide--D-alanyl-D-alanine ligase
MMSLSELAQAVNGTQSGKDAFFSGVSIDGRAIKSGDLYVAIKGERFDGHDFIQQASQAGAIGSLVEQTELTNSPSVSVEETRLALGMLGKYWRQRFNFPVVAITGSNGKTTVKELTTAVLARRYNTLATAGNLNNELGVPLTLLKLRTEHQAAVIEMGANHPGEIAYLANLVLPDIGVVTNAGAAHLEGFGDLQGVANAKGELFTALPNAATAILNRDDEFYSTWKSLTGDRQILSFGLSEQADVRANSIETKHTTQGICSQFQLEYEDQLQIVNLPLTGLHNIVNGLAAAAVGIAVGMTLTEIADGLASVAPVAGRLQTLRGIQNSILVNDSYNANPSSFEAALQAIQDFGTERWCVLGDFGELGEQHSLLHKQLAQQAKKYGITRIFATGELTQLTVAEFGDGATFYNSQDALITALKKQLNKGIVVLVKGSRAQKLENIVEAITDESAA